ncbi:MAG: hypothetical protein A4E28_02062 [Methanocella sp. PtaU1.Bin125]|nr:MAG: hypothetical protein A4E28_02062 [Methanocella sp. PtaU1.Bin125]
MPGQGRNFTALSRAGAPVRRAILAVYLIIVPFSRPPQYMLLTVLQSSIRFPLSMVLPLS